jgi:hypothetical protein
MTGRTKYIFLSICLLTAEVSATENARPKILCGPAKKVGTVQTSMITEASGIVASRKNPPVLWLHNDSGHSARLFAINPEGTLLGTFRLKNAHCRDWEDIAIGPGDDPNRDYLYIGDIGDNFSLHKSIIIYRVPEPKVTVSSVTHSDKDETDNIIPEIQIDSAESIELVYPDGAKDAETLMVDPLNGDIYIVSKRDVFCRVYRAARPQSTQKPTILTKVAVLPWALAVGGDISPDGRYIIIRSMTHASIWERPKDKPLWAAFSSKALNIELVYEPQGESICFDADGKGFFTTSEMEKQPLYYYCLSFDSAKPQK